MISECRSLPSTWPKIGVFDKSPGTSRSGRGKRVVGCIAAVAGRRNVAIFEVRTGRTDGEMGMTRDDDGTTSDRCGSSGARALKNSDLIGTGVVPTCGAFVVSYDLRPSARNGLCCRLPLWLTTVRGGGGVI
jgi:hypothetical protein